MTTLAVSPAALEDLPDVYTALGRNEATYLRICDLPHEGSPTIATFISPRRLMPCKGNEIQQQRDNSAMVRPAKAFACKTANWLFVANVGLFDVPPWSVYALHQTA